MTFKKNIRIYAYNRHSAGGAALGKALGVLRVKHGGEWEAQARHTIINWGAYKLPPNLTFAGRIINAPDKITKTGNKLEFFKQMAVPGGPTLPEWTGDAEIAMQWIAEGHEVLGRGVLNGKGGNGIIFGTDKNTFDDFVDCKLFTKYKKKKEEYRVHFIGNEIVDTQQKMLRLHDDHGEPVDKEHIDYRVRNVANGFIFARGGINPPADVLEQARRTIVASQLDFGAVDVIYNEREGKAYVLEINTAPGLMGTTIDRYTEGFKKYLGLQ